MFPDHKSRLGKLIRLPLRLIPRGFEVRILRGPGRGRKWVSGAAANGYWLGFWDLENLKRFAACLRPEDVVYEIGAHAGLRVLSARKIGASGHIYAFEPLERNLKFLRRHVELNGLANCTIVGAAVCARSGARRMDATICHSEARLCDTGAIPVDGISIDEFVFRRGNRAPTIIDIDTWSAEMEILSGARRTLQEFQPRILLSACRGELAIECSEFLNSLGYETYFAGPGVLHAVPLVHSVKIAGK